MKTAIEHPGKAIAIGVAIAVALLALLPGTWGAALAQTAGTPSPTTEATPTETTVPAGAEATIKAAPDKVIRIPAGAINEEARVVFQPIFDNTTGDNTTVVEVFAQLNVPPPDEADEGTGVVISVFSLDAFDDEGNEVTFDEPVAMDFELTPEVLAAAGGDPNNVVLQFFDEETGEWTPVECSGSGTTVTCLLPHFSIWSLVVRTQAPAQAATPAPADTGMGLSDEGSAANTALLLLAGIVAVAAGAGVGVRLVTKRAQS